MLTNKPRRVPSDIRRAQVLEAAIRAFSQKGFSGAKTRDIAAEAGINEALLFRHFPTKDDLYVAILESIATDDWAESIREGLMETGGDTMAFFRELVIRTLSWYRRRPEFLRLVLFSALEEHELALVFRQRQIGPVLDLLTAYLQAEQDAGRMRRSVPAADAARVLFSTIAQQGLALLLLRDSTGVMTDEQAASAISQILLKGLESPATELNTRERLLNS